MANPLHTVRVPRPKIQLRLGLNGLGFTLFELVMVIGLFSVLVMIAAPMYFRYEAKSKQAEAKLALSAIFSLEKVFHSEYNAYIAGLDAIGYLPEGRRRFYVVGWAAASNPGTVTRFPGSSGHAYFDRFQAPVSYSVCNTAVVLATTAFQNATPQPADINPQVFLANAAGQIRSSYGCDMWYINEGKNLQNISLGY